MFALLKHTFFTLATVVIFSPWEEGEVSGAASQSAGSIPLLGEEGDGVACCLLGADGFGIGITVLVLGLRHVC